MRALPRLLGPIALTLLLAACSARQSQQVNGAAPTRTPLVVGTTDTTPPYAFRRGDEIVGLEPELAMELGYDLGRPVQFVVLPWDDLLNAVARGDVDIAMNGITVTREREDRFAFGKPYTRAKLAAMVRREDLTRFSKRAVACSNPIDTGVVGGTTGESRLRSRCPAMIPRLYPTVRDAVRELGQYRIDGVVHDAPVLAWYAAQSSDFAIIPIPDSEEPLAWVFSLDNSYLRARADESLDRMRSGGTLERLLTRWIPASARSR